MDYKDDPDHWGQQVKIEAEPDFKRGLGNCKAALAVVPLIKNQKFAGVEMVGQVVDSDLQRSVSVMREDSDKQPFMLRCQRAARALGTQLRALATGAD